MKKVIKKISSLAVMSILAFNVSLNAYAACNHSFTGEYATYTLVSTSVISYHTHTDQKTGATYRCSTIEYKYEVTEDCTSGCGGSIVYYRYKYDHVAY